MVTKEVATRGDKELALYELETHFAMAVRQRELLENYIKERLKPDKHFYTVGDDPGRKPSLTKEGAELICLPHALKGHYQWLSGPENPPLDDTPYQITMKCELEANGKFAGEGIGSASSMITKKTGERVQRQKDPGLQHNATIKMACKSAYIAATLNSTAASEFFTQDLEDDQTGSTEKTEGKGHWCSVHKTVFFMRGKMKSYAHPVEGTDEWCHEHTKDKAPEAPKTADAGKDTQAGEDNPPVAQDTSEKNLREGEVVKSPIDEAWLTETLKIVKWSDSTLKSWIKSQKWGVNTDAPLINVLAVLTPEQAKVVYTKISELREAAGN